MFAQPLFRDSVDPVFVPTFGGGLYGPRPGAQQQPQQQQQPTFSHDEPYKRTTCVPTTLASRRTLPAALGRRLTQALFSCCFSLLL